MVNKSCLTSWISRLLPAGSCYLCGEPAYDRMALCRSCTRELPYIDNPCARCAQPLYTTICPWCEACAPSFDKARCVFNYSYPVNLLIKQLKFSSNLLLVQTLALELTEVVRREVSELPEAIIPVPLYRERLALRGYNQSLEIARVLSKELGIPLDYRLVRKRGNTPPQSGLSRVLREHNVRGAFSLSLVNGLPYRRVAIVDDIITTGSTADEISRLLKQGGVTDVEVWACARTIL